MNTLPQSIAQNKASFTGIFFLFLHEIVGCGYSLEAPWRGTSNEYPQPTFCGETRKLICGYLSNLELWIDPLIWSYDSRHVQKDERNGSRVNTLRQFIAPDTDKTSFLTKMYCYRRITEMDCWETCSTFRTNMKQRLVSALYNKRPMGHGSLT